MSTQENFDEPHDRENARAFRRRLVLAVGLLAVTLALGAAAHRIDAVVVPPPDAPGPLLFQAPGAGPVHFTGQLDRGSVLVGGDGAVRMELVLRGDELPGHVQPRVPTDLMVILDRSGSMQGQPLAHAKASVRALMGQLSAEDRFALVSYASDVRLEWPLERAHARQRRLWDARLAGIAADGGTNMAIGIDRANQTLATSARAGRAARVVLLSDGHANQGDHSLAGLRRRAAQAVRGEYVFSTAGVGQGFDEALLAALADAGTGNFYYVQHVEELAGVFADEFASARETVASGAVVTIRPGRGVQVLDAAGYPLERSGGEVRFRPGDLFAGQERRIWVTLQMPTDSEGAFDLGRFAVSYRSSEGLEERVFAGRPRIACVPSEDDYYASVDGDAWARSTLVDEYNALKQKVSSAVQAGYRDEALDELRRFKEQKKRENARLQRQDVADALVGLDALESEVDEAFAAEPSAAPALQNDLGKRLSAEGYDGRRVGAKR